jgi:very-short-patch-repair endonuclease
LRITGPYATKARATQLRSAMSLPERILWSLLRRKSTGLRFRRQQPAGPYVLDFYCDSLKLCIEIDGEQHDFTVAKDAARDRWLSDLGIRTIRIAARDVLRNPDGVVAWIAGLGRSPSVPLRGPPPPVGEET